MNVVSLLGRLVKDPESRNTTNSTVTSFTLAINRQFKREGQPEADFINCVAWGKTAEFIAKYFAKGRQVAVTGRLQQRKWEDTEGKSHYVVEVVVESTFFADSKPAGQQSEDSVNLSAEDLMGDELLF